MFNILRCIFIGIFNFYFRTIKIPWQMNRIMLYIIFLLLKMNLVYFIVAVLCINKINFTYKIIE